MATSRTGSKVKSLLSSVIELVQVRFQLLTLEARAETGRLLGMVVFGILAAALLVVSLVFFGLLIVAHYWDTPQRMWAVFFVGLGLLGLSGLSGLVVWSKIRQGRQLFASSIRELQEDVERLQS